MHKHNINYHKINEEYINSEHMSVENSPTQLFLPYRKTFTSIFGKNY